MGRHCPEPYCLQDVPDQLYESHQDQHIAERLAAEDFEAFKQQHDDRAWDNTVANDPFDFTFEDRDMQLALALNREFRQEEEERSFRQVQVLSSTIESDRRREK